MAEIEIKLKGLAQIKSELRELKGELANATDPAQMAKLAEQAGLLKDQLADANEQVAVFATGSKFEQVSNSFGSMKDSLMSLDFEEAAQKAKMFQKTLGGISPATIGAGIKGLISVVGTLSKAFVQFGLSLLTNPIFLLVAVIAAVVAGIVYFLNKLGVLKAIMKAIGDVVGWLIQGFKDLTDWIGLTNHANTKRAEEAAKALEEEREGIRKVVSGIDNKISMLEAEGKSTLALRMEKNELLKVEAKLNAESIRAVSDMADKSSVFGKVYGELADKSGEVVHKLEVEEKKLTTELANENKKRAEDHKKYLEDRLSATRLVQDLNLQLMNEGIKKELLENKYKFERLIEDLKTNEKLIGSEKKRLTELYGIQYAEARDKINLKDLARIQKFEEDAKKIKQAAEDEWLKIVEDIAEQNYVNSLSTKDKELLAVNDKYFALQEAAKGNAEQMAIIETAKATEIGAIEDKAAKDEITRLQAVADAKLAIQNADLAMVSQGIGVLKSIFEKNKAIQKGALIAENAIGVAKIIISTAAANAAALTTPQAILTSGASAVPVIARNRISAGIGIASIIASTAKGLSALGGGGTVSGTAPGGGGGGGNTSTQQATPSVTLSGANNNANTFGANNQQNQGGQMTVKAVVVESDVTSMQNKINKIQQSAVL